MTESTVYTTQLQAGLGLVNETIELLRLWSPGVSSAQLYRMALESGQFPNITARRLRNIVSECFAPRYLIANAEPAVHMKLLLERLTAPDLTQLMLIYTSRANPILGDFIRDAYWPRYVGGFQEMSTDDARRFVEQSIDEGKTSKRWSESTVRRISAYLTGCCADYGLLERGSKSRRRMILFRILPSVSTYLAYELHFRGVSDSALLNHADWQLFGLNRNDVISELKRMSLRGSAIIQAAGDIVKISWKHSNMQEVCNVLIAS